MPMITVQNGILESHYTDLAAGTITGYVLHTLSNGFTDRIAHVVLIAAVQQRATLAGRADYKTDDICQEIAASIPDFLPNVITPAGA